MSPVRLISLVLVLFTLALYSRVRDFEFVGFDDPVYVTENPYVQPGLTPEGLSWAFWNLHGEATYWHPLTWVSHMLDCQLFGLDSGAHHIVNVLFHALNVLLLFHVLRRMTGAVWRSAFVAALFACHPLQVDTVAWITERKNLLGGLFWLLTMLAYLRYTETATRGRYVLVLVCFALGLMAKPVLVTLPCVLLLLDLWPLRRVAWSKSRGKRLKTQPEQITPRRAVMEKLPLLGLSFISSIITLAAHAKLGTTISAEELSVGARIANAFVSYGRYLVKTFWPTRLSVYYPLENWAAWQVAAAVIVFVALTAGVVLWRFRRPYAAVGWLWFVGVLVPTIGLVQASTQAMADRFAYLPLIGLFIAIVWLMAEWLERTKQRKSLAVAVGGVVLVALCVVTWIQLGVWRNTITLFTHALAVTSGNAVAHNNLGAAFEGKRQFAEAEKHYREAIRLKPKSPQAHNNLGNVLDEVGRSGEALAAYQQAIALRPNVALVHNNLGIVLAKLGRFDEAQTNFLRAMELQPRHGHAHYLMGTLHLRRGDARAARTAFETALQITPNHVRALALLSRLLSASDDPALRDGPRAVQLAERAVLASKEVQPAILDTLAMAYAETGRFNEAGKAEDSAAEMLKVSGDDAALLDQVLQRRGLFQARTPYRESVSNLVAQRVGK